MRHRTRIQRTFAWLAPVVLLTLCVSLPGCSLVRPHASGQSLVPSRYQTSVGPYRVWTNRPVIADDPAIHQLMALERQLQERLALRIDPAAAPIDIFILDDRGAFEHFLKFYYPQLPPRRAFFLARGDRRIVYTYRGDRLIEDLRHESTHALLHASVGDMPLWLDEGLAEYFEVPEQNRGLNEEHVARLPHELAAGWGPDLDRLERFRDVREMSPRDYRESWAWAHYLLDGPAAGQAALLAYLADIRTGQVDRPLSARLNSGESPPADQMVAHLEQEIQTRRLAGSRPLEPRTLIRGQDPSLEAVISPSPAEGPRHRGLFGRMLDAVGLGSSEPKDAVEFKTRRR